MIRNLAVLTTAFSLMISLPVQSSSEERVIEPAVHSQHQEPTGQALVNINVTLELDGIERSIDKTSESLSEVALSLDAISKSTSLTLDQQDALDETVSNINRLMAVSQTSMEMLPSTIETSAQAINLASQDFLADLELKVLMVLVVALLILVVAVFCVYWFLLRPMQGTLVKVTHNMSSMAAAVKTTSEALESTTTQQKNIMDALSDKEQALLEKN